MPTDRRKEPRPEPTKEGRDRFRKAKTKSWSDVFQGLNIEHELETTNSDKSGKKSETPDSMEQFHSKKTNNLKAMQAKGKQKHQHRDSKVAGKGIRADKPIERVEAHEIKRVEER